MYGICGGGDIIIIITIIIIIFTIISPMRGRCMYGVCGGEEGTDILRHPHRGLHPRAVASHLSKIVYLYVSFIIYD